MTKPNIDLLGKEVYLIFHDKEKKTIQVTEKIVIQTIVLGRIDVYYGSTQVPRNIYPENICMTKEDLELKIDELRNKPDIQLSKA